MAQRSGDGGCRLRRDVFSTPLKDYRVCLRPWLPRRSAGDIASALRTTIAGASSSRTDESIDLAGPSDRSPRDQTRALESGWHSVLLALEVALNRTGELLKMEPCVLMRRTSTGNPKPALGRAARPRRVFQSSFEVVRSSVSKSTAKRRQPQFLASQNSSPYRNQPDCDTVPED